MKTLGKVIVGVSIAVVVVVAIGVGVGIGLRRRAAAKSGGLSLYKLNETYASSASARWYASF
jgi:hypothetical protein